MKYLMLAIFLTGCSVGGTPGQPAYDYTDLRSYEDSARGVVCYRVVGYEGLSCLKLTPSTEEALKEKQLKEIFK